MWGECDQHDGMHFNAQRYVALELVDPQTGQALPWADGASGELVYTTFAREATPVVRYRSRDHAVVTGMRCACGRTSPRIRCIGRTDDMLIYKGMNVFPTAIRDLVCERFGPRVQPMVRVWKHHKDQVRFDEPIEVDVESTQPLEPPQQAALARDIETAVRAGLQLRVAVSVMQPGALPRNVYKNALLAVREPKEKP
jgi:phenylacetate-coenzyme A ligase PaaK-like adenylate-forming protein